MVSSGARVRFCTFFVKSMEFLVWCVPDQSGQDAGEVFVDVVELMLPDNGSE